MLLGRFDRQIEDYQRRERECARYPEVAAFARISAANVLRGGDCSTLGIWRGP